ncbi:cytochrome P450 CYP72A219-like protein [Cinnamomum micranthum f. kanehirae]|uniref:Cytochrome P450 CYP72A219-like protein n=1 Tax=Cinnamomum micranthum f. kanehirae TaxID=337451 RepID=A0A443PE98_9MAGN|nr:cytochrome P450 CYP72A219-like protein [Cinnamomum micranthum f. kanehirae]
MTSDVKFSSSGQTSISREPSEPTSFSHLLINSLQLFWTLEGCCGCEIEKMGDVMLKLFIFFCVLLFSWIWRLFYTIWWRPMKLQSYLNQQGIHGHRYKLIHGNLKDIDRYSREALCQPINLTHKIQSRVLPFLDQTIKSYAHGTCDVYLLE